MKILAVDDDRSFREVLAASLGAIGYHDLVLADSAEAAVRLVLGRKVPFDCVLLDIQMPGKNGLDLCHWLRKLPGYRSCPIVMLTSLTERSFLDRAFSLGASDYLTKPIDMVELGARVRNADRLCRANRAIDNSETAIRALGAELEKGRRFDLADAVVIDDVAGVIDILALENYLLRVSRGELLTSSALAFGLVDAKKIFARCLGTTLFRDILADTAECVLETMRGQRGLMAYAGNGAFVGLSNLVSADLGEIETCSNQLIADLGLIDRDGASLDVTIRFGTPVRFGLLRSGRSMVGILNEAIDRIPLAADEASVRQGSKKGRSPLSLLMQASFH